MEVFLSDNVGNRVPPGCSSGAPKLASGITLTDTTTGGDHTQTLVGGHTYKAMANSIGDWVFGIAAITAAANIMWFLPANQVMVFTMPVGYTALHYECLTNTGTCYLVELLGWDNPEGL